MLSDAVDVFVGEIFQQVTVGPDAKLPAQNFFSFSGLRPADT